MSIGWMSRSENGMPSRIISRAKIIAIGSGSVPTDQQRRQLAMERRVWLSKCGKLIRASRKLRRASQSSSLNSVAIYIIDMSMQRAGQNPHSKIYSQIDGLRSLGSAGGTKAGKMTTTKNTTQI